MGKGHVCGSFDQLVGENYRQCQSEGGLGKQSTACTLIVQLPLAINGKCSFILRAYCAGIYILYILLATMRKISKISLKFH